MLTLLGIDAIFKEIIIILTNKNFFIFIFLFGPIPAKCEHANKMVRYKNKVLHFYDAHSSPNLTCLQSIISGGGIELNSDSTALVTMPGDQEGQNGTLTSPNLVHNMNPGMSLASATSFAKMQSSSSSSRKESSTSMSTMRGQDGQAVVSCSAQQQSASSASSQSASIGGKFIMSSLKSFLLLRAKLNQELSISS